MVAVRGEGSRLVTGGVARLEPGAGVRAALISGRVRPGAAGSERVMDGAVRLTVGVRGVAAAVAAGRVIVVAGALRPMAVAGARVTAAGGWATGARGVATDGAAGRVIVVAGAVRSVTGARVTAVRVWTGWSDGAALGVLVGRGCITTGRGAVVGTGRGADWRVTAGAEGIRVTDGCGALTRDGSDCTRGADTAAEDRLEGAD